MTRDTGASASLEALAWRGWVVLADRRLPGREGGTVDHVVVGPGGVYVISRQRWPGPVDVVDGELHLGGRPQPGDVTAVSGAAARVLALVPDVPVQPVLCLERHQPVSGWVRNVMLCGSSNVEEVLTTRPAVLGSAQVQQVGEVLAARLSPVPPPPAAAAPPRTAAPWPVRMVLQAVTMATAALLVIAALQSGVVTQLSTVVGDFVRDVATVTDEPKRKPAREESPQERSRQRTQQNKASGTR